jgi:hypothetical protein
MKFYSSKVIMANEEIHSYKFCSKYMYAGCSFIPGETPSGQHPKYDAVQFSTLITPHPSKLGPAATLLPSGQQP